MRKLIVSFFTLGVIILLSFLVASSLHTSYFDVTVFIGFIVFGFLYWFKNNIQKLSVPTIHGIFPISGVRPQARTNEEAEEMGKVHVNVPILTSAIYTLASLVITIALYWDKF